MAYGKSRGSVESRRSIEVAWSGTLRFGNKHLGAVFIFPRDRLERMKPAEVKDYLSYDLYKNFKDTRSLGKIFRYPLIEDHLARYEWAKEQVLGDVLDVGCGSGFGSELLAEGSKVSSVTGLDIHLYDLHESTKVSFVEADIISSELPTRTFNSVVTKTISVPAAVAGAPGFNMVVLDDITALGGTTASITGAGLATLYVQAVQWSHPR